MEGRIDKMAAMLSQSFAVLLITILFLILFVDRIDRVSQIKLGKI